MRAAGEMPEWPNGTDSKSVEQATVPRVRIPISPPPLKDKPLKLLEFQGLFRFWSVKCRKLAGQARKPLADCLLTGVDTKKCPLSTEQFIYLLAYWGDIDRLRYCLSTRLLA
jgi:hypothetical protein